MSSHKGDFLVGWPVVWQRTWSDGDARVGLPRRSCNDSQSSYRNESLKVLVASVGSFFLSNTDSWIYIHNVSGSTLFSDIACSSLNFTECPLTLAAQLEGCAELIKVLKSGGAHLDFRTKDGITALHKAVRSKNHTALIVSITHINTLGLESWTLSFISCFSPCLQTSPQGKKSLQAGNLFQKVAWAIEYRGCLRNYLIC